jgi:hypothetical protein
MKPRPSSLARWAGAAVCGLGLWVGAFAQAPTAKLPTGMSFVGQDAMGAWRLYRVDDANAIVPIATQQEPRQACVAPAAKTAVYAAADGSLRLVRWDGGRESVVAASNAQRAYTQPCLSGDGSEVYAVEMADGKSIETELVRFAQGKDPAQRFARQPGAQHDPFVHQGRWLVYAHVGCSDGCEQLLVEIWARDLVAVQARQLTLLNALSQVPVTDGKRVVFSSNASGTFQLWEVGIDGKGQRMLTSGVAQATQPALCAGSTYFIRATPQGSSIALLAPDGSAQDIPTPGFKAVRALRCVS